MLRLPSIVVFLLAMTMSAAASDPVLHAAGSLRSALTEVAAAFAAASGQKVGQRALARYGFSAPLLPP